jgi:two-component system OmpR family response regulator
VTSLPRRLLVVDDDDDLRTGLVDMLTAEGWEVREARHGGEALEVLSEFEPSVMLLDWRMPVMDGAEVLERLGDARERLRVVLITASAHARELAEKHRLRFHIGKPFGIDELLATVDEAHAAGRLAS